MCGCTL